MKRIILLGSLIFAGIATSLIAQTWVPLPNPDINGYAYGICANPKNGNITIFRFVYDTTFVFGGYMTPVTWDGNQWSAGTPSMSREISGFINVLSAGDSIWISAKCLFLYYNDQWTYYPIKGYLPQGPNHINSITWHNNRLYAAGQFYTMLPDSSWCNNSVGILAWFDGNEFIPIKRFKGYITKIESIDNILYLCGDYIDTITNTRSTLGYLDDSLHVTIDTTTSCQNFIKAGDGYYMVHYDHNTPGFLAVAIFHLDSSGLTEITAGKHLYSAIQTVAYYDNKLVIAGCFDDTAGGAGIQFRHVAAIDSAGNLFSLQQGFNDIVTDLILSNNTLVASGGFTLADNQPAFGVATWTGAITNVEHTPLPLKGKPFPNPSTGVINIPISGINSTIEIFSLSGTMVFRDEISTSGETYHKLDLGFLKSGIYLAVLKNKTSQQVWKIVLKSHEH